MRALRILASRWPTFLSLGFFAFLGLLLSPCLVGVPVLIGVLVSLTGTSLDAACKARDLPLRRPSGGGTWVAALSIFAFLASAMLAGLAAVEAFEGVWPAASEAVSRIAFVAATAIVSACLSPLAFVPFAAIDEGSTLSDAAFRSAHVSARRGSLRQIATVVASTIVLFSPVLLDAILTPVRHDPVWPWAIALVVSTIVAVPLAFVLLADAYLAADPRASTATRTSASSSRSAGRVLLVAVALLVGLLACALVAAALVPSTMVPSGDRDRQPRGAPTASMDDTGLIPRVRIEGTSLTVRGTTDGLVVEADDGGGVGLVRTRSIGAPQTLWIRRTGRQPSAPIALRTTGRQIDVTERLLIDVNGVRLDDDVFDRWSHRVGSFGALLVSLAAILAILALWRVAALLAAARHLGRPLAGSTSGHGIAALDGKLRLAPNASLWISPARWAFGRGSAEVRGDAWLEAHDGQLRLRIPPGHAPALFHAPTARPLSDGEAVSVVGRFGRIGSGTRDAEIPWPASSALVAGDHQSAKSFMTARAMQSWAALAAVLMVVLACAVLWITLRC